MANRFVKGSDVTITVRLKDKATGGPFYLDSFTAATGYLLKDDDSTYLAVSGTQSTEDLSEVSFFVPKADSVDLAAGEEQDFQADFDYGGTRTRVKFEGKLTIEESLV